jgi:acetoin utilization protein AcuC
MEESDTNTARDYERACVVFDERLTEYNFGPSHPMAPVRVKLTMELARDLNVLDDVDIVPARPATEDELASVHSEKYIEQVMHVSKHPIHSEPTAGLGTEDNPVFEHMHEASALIAGASLEAAKLVWTGERRRAINVSGGLHHAMPNRASGFCIYNDIALGIRWMLDNGAERIVYIDVDAHHGDGVQAMFYHDPRVLTISLHESPKTLFPGTGYSTEIGAEGAEGSAVNVPLPPGTSDAGWLRAFYAVVPQLIREFNPQVIFSQHGCDSHMDDPLTNLMLTVDGQRAAYLAIRDLADTYTKGRWIATGGGGYAVVDVVPRAWAHLISIVADNPLDPQTPTPEAWREHVLQMREQPAPSRMTDGRRALYRPWEEGYDPANWLDRSIQATRNEAFPLFGLDPHL